MDMFQSLLLCLILNTGLFSKAELLNVEQKAVICPPQTLFKPPPVRNNQSDERRGGGGNGRSDRKGCASPQTGTKTSPNVLATRDKVDPENLGGQQGTTDSFSTR